MYKNIATDAQEVKRQLEFIGRNDIDEAVICDLLNSFHTDYTLDSVMDLILSTSNNNNSDTPSKAIKQEDSNVTTITIEKGDTETKKDNNMSENLDLSVTMDDAPIEIDDTTDSDEDDDSYYDIRNWDDMSYTDDTPPMNICEDSETARQDSNELNDMDNGPETSSPALMNACDDSGTSRQDLTELSNTADIEILEENNNDPNNNMESIQAREEELTCSTNMETETYKENTCMRVESPQPGCSKDFDKEEYVDNPKIREEAMKICNILPSFRFALVYETHLRNARAENRMELTIWDLLPDKRPCPHYSLKRKYVADGCIMKDSNSFSNVPQNSDNGLNNVDAVDCKRSNKETFSKLFNPFSSTSKNVLFDTKTKVVTKIWNNSTKPSSGATESILLKSALDPEVMSAECSSSMCKEDTIPLKPNILRPPILNVTSQKQTNQAPASTTNQQSPLNTTNEQILVKTSNQKTVPNVTSCQSVSSVVNQQGSLNVASQQLAATTINNQNTKHSYKNSPQAATPRNSVIKPPRLIYNYPQSPNSPASSVTVVSSTGASPDRVSVKVIKLTGAPSESNNVIQLTPIATSRNMVFNLNNKSYRIIPIAPQKKPTENSQENFAIPSTSKAPHNNILSSTTEESHPTSSSSVSTSSMSNSKELSYQAATTSAINPPITSHEDASSTKNLNRVTSCVTSQSLTKAEQYQSNIPKQDKLLETKLALMCDKLISMFPEVDVDYIRELCTSNLEKEKNMSDMERLNNLTEHLLDKEASNLNEQDALTEEAAINKQNTNLTSILPNVSPEGVAIDEQYTNLIGIFPDADPTYLRQKAEALYNKPDDLREYIQCKLEDRNYPTREQYYAKQKITEQQKEYTTDFKVETFLEIFPNPFEYFEDPKRQCKFNREAFEFLQSRFNYNKVCTLMLYYRQNKYNLSLTVKAVERLRPDMANKRKKHTIYPPQDIPLLQEMAFINHKQEILYYLSGVKALEVQEFQEYKRNNALLQCQCCYEDECMPSKCSHCENGHVFCNSCVVRGTEAKLADGQTHITCFTNCTSEFGLSVLQRILPPTKFSILLRKRQEEEVMAAGLDGLVSCPYCHFASIPPPEDKIFKCLNPECMKETCRFCKELNHVPLKCGEAKSEEKARHYLEEKMTEALVRKCYRCDRPFFKEDGCNKIYCVCGAMMCYICDKPIKGYEHFSQNASRPDRCPLWSDNRSINTVSVLKVAEQAMKHIQQKDPNVKLNARRLLPQMPRRHNDQMQGVYDATTLPVRTYNVGRFDS